ncbi:MAG: two-component system sensor histidine kinase AlgZ [Gammaproteobacteria bacterium]|jgi:two-component system sensor histidine kinase AlgZ
MKSTDITERATFLPDLCGVRAIFGIVIIGELLAVVLTLVSSGTTPGAIDKLSLISLYTQWVGLSGAGVLCLLGRWINPLPESTVAVASFLAILLVATIVSELAWHVINPMTGIDPLIRIAHGDFLARTLGISAIVGAMVLRYFYVQHHWKLRIVSEAQARLDALQARIRPHFFFNCMNTIASLTRTDPRAAERAVEDLADLFRASLGRVRSLASLEEEFELVRGYLNIEALRLGDRLQVKWDIEALPAGARIPLLTLQPLVENAIYHGIEPLPAGGLIEISAVCRNARIEISIANPVSSEKVGKHRGNQVALENVKQRIAANFGAQGGIEVQANEERYQVTITVPAAAELVELTDAYHHS